MTTPTASPALFTAREKFEAGVHEIAIDHSDPAAGQWISYGGPRDPKVIPLQKKIAKTYTADERTEAEAKALKSAVSGTKITVLWLGADGFAQIVEGTGLANDGKPTLLFKGSTVRGHYLDGLGIVAVAAGHGKAKALVDDYNKRAASAR
jgi:hypothetical protein